MSISESDKTMYEVRDGVRTLKFNGSKLGEASSWRTGSPRWIEFELYKTDGGQYVLSRVGVSLTFHSAVCPLVVRYGLHEVDPSQIAADAIACPECEPTFDEPLLFPEKYRYWTLVSDDASIVLDALYKPDSSGARYLTNVSRRLLERAARNDAEIDSVYRIEIIL
jgi:hypothetical protein